MEKTSIEGKLCWGGASTVTTDTNHQQVNKLVCTEKTSYNQWACNGCKALEKMVEGFGYWKVSANWVPQQLTSALKEKNVEDTALICWKHLRQIFFSWSGDKEWDVTIFLWCRNKGSIQEMMSHLFSRTKKSSRVNDQYRKVGYYIMGGQEHCSWFSGMWLFYEQWGVPWDTQTT